MVIENRNNSFGIIWQDAENGVGVIEVSASTNEIKWFFDQWPIAGLEIANFIIPGWEGAGSWVSIEPGNYLKLKLNGFLRQPSGCEFWLVSTSAKITFFHKVSLLLTFK